MMRKSNERQRGRVDCQREGTWLEIILYLLLGGEEGARAVDQPVEIQGVLNQQEHEDMVHVVDISQHVCRRAPLQMVSLVVCWQL